MDDFEFNLFDSKGVANTLLYLLACYPNPKRKTDIRNELKLHINTAMTSFDVLSESGLLKSIKSRFDNRDKYTLSSRGLSIAKHLFEIKKTVDEIQQLQRQGNEWFEFEFNDDPPK